MYRKVHTVQIYTLLGPSFILLTLFTSGEKTEDKEIVFLTPSSSSSLWNLIHLAAYAASSLQASIFSERALNCRDSFPILQTPLQHLS